MAASLHEDLSRADEVQIGSERSFGLTVGGILLAIAAWHGVSGGVGWFEAALALPGAALVVAALVVPRRLAPLNRAWAALGLLLGRIVSPVVLALIYATAFVPIGLARRAFGNDSLGLRRASDASTYWISKDPAGPAPETMTRQF